MNHLPRSSLYESRPARIELARRRYFEEGQVPTGVVNADVFESWARCLRLHGDPNERATFQPVTASRAQLALTKNRHLHQAWMAEVPRLESVLGSTSCAAMLTDATGVLIGSSCAGRSHEELMPVATRLGVDLSEDAVGTTAPGVAARTGRPVCVLGGEHFFDSVKEMHCAAAPIRDVRGHLAGVLDLSSESLPFSFDAATVAGLFAGAIENRLLVAQSTEHLVIRFQVAAELVDSPLVGLIGIGTDGLLAWQNGVARKLLSGPLASNDPSDRAGHVAHGLPLQRWASLPADGAAPLTLPNGLLVWARADMRAPDGRRGLVPGARPSAMPIPDSTPAIRHDAPPQAPVASDVDIRGDSSASAEVPSKSPAGHAPQRLRESDLEVIERTIQACKGNMSAAAKRLGVSRGLIYRRLRASGRFDKASRN